MSKLAVYITDKEELDSTNKYLAEIMNIEKLNVIKDTLNITNKNSFTINILTERNLKVEYGMLINITHLLDKEKFVINENIQEDKDTVGTLFLS